MKILEIEFVCNYDKRGDNKFVQVKRNEYGAIYQRFTMDGTPKEYEVFQIKVAGGCEIFGRKYDKYEAYPGSSSFGRTAWSVDSLERAEEIFAEITKGKGKRWDGAEAKTASVKLRRAGTGRRGRIAAVRPAIVFPKKQFCMKDLVATNKKGWSQPTLYIALKKLVASRKVVETDRKQIGRGRPQVFYKVKA